VGSLSAKLAEMATLLPELAEDAEAITLLDEHVQRLRVEPFFEPVSVTRVSKGKKQDVLGGKRELLGISPEDLTSWTRHIAYGVRCRLRVLEEPIVEQLLRGQTLPAMILLRSHLEAAALAAFCLKELTAAVRQGSVQTLKELIPRTLFGTALKKHRDNVSVGDLLKFFEGDTIQICAAIESLDEFYYREHADGTLSVAYSILCEFAHPNHRGVMDFMVASERPGGWEVTYGLEAPPKPGLIRRGLDTLLVSMRAGYSATELLRCWQFTENGGEVVWCGPSPDDAKRVWRDLLQRPAGGTAD
jgi:hypothetical protein